MKSHWIIPLIFALLFCGSCKKDDKDSTDSPETKKVLRVHRNQEFVEEHIYTDSRLIMDRYHIPWSNIWDTAEYYYENGRLRYIVHYNAITNPDRDTSYVTYDVQMRLTQVGYREGGMFEVEYNNQNRKKRITLSNYFISGTHDFENENSKYAHFSTGPSESFDTSFYEVTPNPLHRFWMTHPNPELMSKKNIITRNRKTEVEHIDWNGDVHILTYYYEWNYDYIYDAQGRVTIMNERDVATGNRTVYTFEYDELPE